MGTTLETLSPPAGARKKKKRLGRGIGSHRGKTSGKGMKGQLYRHRAMPVSFEGGQLPIQQGSFAADFWYAPGIGHVLSEEVLETKVLTARGALDTKVTERMALKRFRSGASRPARRSY